MCDYSLDHFPNRLCADGEELIAYRFSSGCIGLVSSAEARSRSSTDPTWFQSNWPNLRSWFFPRMVQRSPVAVCVPPGTQLTVGARDQATLIHRRLEAFRYRDRLQFDDGREILLQELSPGTRIRINPALNQADDLRQLETSACCEPA